MAHHDNIPSSLRADSLSVILFARVSWRCREVEPVKIAAFAAKIVAHKFPK